jgi:predicted MFS family arabinose efflux permease
MTQETASPRTRLSTLPALLTVSVLTRLVVNTANQLFNPFLSVIAAGLGMDVVTLGRLVGLRSAMGMCAPFFGNLADRWGYRAVMRLQLLIGVVGLLLVGGSLHGWMAVLGMALMGAGLYSFVPTLRAYLSFQLPYAQRGRGFGILEYSWALSGIVGLFLMGKLMDLSSWRAPFFVLAIGLLVAWGVFAQLPPTSRLTEASVLPARGQAGGYIQRFAAFFALDSNRWSAWSAILAGTIANYGTLHLFAVYGAWLAGEYGLTSGQLGLVALVLGCADLCGSVSVSLLTDRLGKRRSTLLGLSGALIVFALLPLVNHVLWTTIGVLAVARAFFEFGTVSQISLVSEQVPTQRGKVMTLAFACGLIGNTLSGFTGPFAYTHYGIVGLAPVTVIMIAIGLVMIGAWVKEREA